MNSHVLLLRGINVGGKNLLPMKALSGLLRDLGCEAVRTYIQSGNVVLRSTAQVAATLREQLGAEIGRQLGFEPHVLLLDSAAFREAMKANPYPEAADNPKTLHLGFLDAKPPRPDMQKLEALKARSERFKLIDKVFYLHAPDGVGNSKLANSSEKLLGVPMTDRNWRTVCKIHEMLEQAEAAPPGR